MKNEKYRNEVNGHILMKLVFEIKFYSIFSTIKQKQPESICKT